MKISIIGTGYMGLATGVGFASKKNHVICMDIDKKRLEKIEKGKSPVYETGLQDLLEGVIEKKNLEVSSDLDYTVKNSDVSFICVPTPSKRDGSSDLKFIDKVSREIGVILAKKDSYHVVVVKSTVPPRTTEKLVIPNLEEFSGKKAGEGFGVCMNPEFLREGSALEDFLNPDRIVIGELDRRSGDVLVELYANFNAPILRTNLKVAEMVKYASNAFLASKISFANEIGNLCKNLGIDVYEVMMGIGLDHRISPHFLRAGIGFGGSCFSKDLKALVNKSKTIGYDPVYLEEVLNLNERQPVRIVNLLRKRVGTLGGRNICVLGLAFKPNTDDVRGASSIGVVKELLKFGARVRAYDPRATDNFKEIFPDLLYCKTAKEALRGSDACLVLTEWEDFKNLEDKDFSVMKNRVIIEGRKALNPNKVKDFEGVCW
ncbi:MAG: UDP-glucose/GDP-mannose dehydrogenase family protein [Candidatus Aenigmarchaeota archaeon]|nr:UDP-glucose/GDP-mannose dehydrogenase family protein [Candidatus Aenigmarchaeota archaeon]